MSHSKFSPSAAHRWMRCPGSLTLEARLPEQGPNRYADEGTAAHILAANALMSREEPVRFVGTTVEVREGLEWTVTEDMAGHVKTYTDLVKSITGNLLVEQKLDYSDVVQVAGSYGTGDAVVFTNHGELHIVDLKYGMGVRVDAEKNEQLMIYAIAALDQYAALGPFHTVHMTICQPRLNHISTYTVEAEELEVFAASVRTTVQRITIGALEDVFVPGEKQCQWCRAKPTCPALRAMVDHTLRADFADLVHGPDDDLGGAMAKLDLLEMWAKAVRDETMRRLMNGTPVPGFKLVEGRRGNREWVNTNAVADALAQTNVPQEEIFTTSMNSPAKIEKALKKYAPLQIDNVMQYTTQSPGKPALAPDSDKRPSYVFAAGASAFSDLVD